MKHLVILLLFSITAYLGFLVSRKYNPICVIKSKFKEKPTTQKVVDRLSDQVYKQLKPFLDKANFSELPSQIMIIAYKEEQILKVYGQQANTWKHIKSYPFTATSGQLGPKLKEGDKQIPEGIYSIEYLNPASLYYLSMKVNYPNAFDKEKGRLDNRTNIGSDIFIHGKATTIGCIPIGDKAIEELFIMAEAAYKNEIKVIISPRDFTEAKSYPKVESVTWSEELYDMIKKELNTLALQG